MAKYTTKGLSLGSREAESESKDILKLYVDYMGIEDSLNNGKFIITGRKGSGKSAYALWLKEASINDDDLWCKILKYNDRLLEQIIHFKAQDIITQSMLFEWLIICNYVELITSSNRGKYADFSKQLYEFKRKNPHIMNGGIYNLQDVITKGKIDISPFRGHVADVYGSVEKDFHKADFLTTLKYLKDMVIKSLNQNELSTIKYYIFFDDLDVKFKLYDNSDKEKLVDLLRVVRDYNTMNLSHTQSKIILLLRDDITEQLADVECDSTKIIGSYEKRINWYDHTNEGALLRKFINHRIEVCFNKNGIKHKNAELWSLLVSNDFIDTKTSFKYVLDHTFYLPRDLIMIFETMSNHNFILPLSKNDLDILLQDYTKAKYSEMKNELTAVWCSQKINSAFCLLEELFEIICGGQDVDYNLLSRQLIQYNFNDNDFEIFVEYNLLIPKDIQTGNLYFKYREKVASRKRTKYIYTLPKVLMMYFSVMT